MTTTWWKIKNIPRKIKSRIENYCLVKKYPWLHPIDWGKDKNGEYVEIRDPNYKYDYVSIFKNKRGWWKAFGKLFCDEIQEHYAECPNMYVLEEKEKYGSLRISFGNANKAVDDICEKYEHISQNICYFCGKEAPMTNTGWLLPVCEYCYAKEKWGVRPYKEVIMRGDDGRMSECYIICTSDGRKKIDISDTVKEIRKKYAKNR